MKKVLTFIEIAEIYKKTKIKNFLLEQLVEPKNELYFNHAIQFLKDKNFQSESEVLLFLMSTV